MGTMCAAVSASNRAAVAAVPPVAGGRTVAEIITGRKKLSGQTVVVRGLVVKVVPHILGRNFLHVRDGSGIDGSNDLVVTTEAEIKEQSTVTLSGKVVTDKDFGSGYRYEVLVEDARVVTP
jgi:aspartyl/asparaginyl-tRNA synthetase